MASPLNPAGPLRPRAQRPGDVAGGAGGEVEVPGNEPRGLAVAGEGGLRGGGALVQQPPGDDPRIAFGQTHVSPPSGLL